MLISGYGPQAAIVFLRNDFANLAVRVNGLLTIDESNTFKTITAIIDIPQESQPTILRGYNNGLDAVTYGSGKILSQRSMLFDSAKSYFSTEKPIDWSTISAATRLDVVVTGDTDFTISDLNPSLGKVSFLQQAREKLALLKLPVIITADYTWDGKFRLLTPPTFTIKTIKEQVRFASSNVAMDSIPSTNAASTVPPLGPYPYTTFDNKTIKVWPRFENDPNNLRQHSLTEDSIKLTNIADDFVLVLNLKLYRSGYKMKDPKRTFYNPTYIDLPIDVVGNKIPLTVNSKGTPQEIAQQLNRRFQSAVQTVSVRETSFGFGYDYTNYTNSVYELVGANYAIELKAVVENNAVVIRFASVTFLSLNHLRVGPDWNEKATLGINLGTPSWNQNALSIENATRSFKSVLGFGGTGTGFKTDVISGDERQDFGAARAVVALPKNIQTPWRYTFETLVTTKGYNLGLVNNDAYPDFGVADNSSFRMWYGTGDTQFLNKPPVLTISDPLSNSLSKAELTGTAGDFNGDGKTDLAIKVQHWGSVNFSDTNNKGSLESRIAIYYSIADKIAAGTTTLTTFQADVTLMGGSLTDGFGLLASQPNLDVNRDGYNDLVVSATSGNRVYIAPGTFINRFAPNNLVELSTFGIAGRGSFLTDTGAGVFAFNDSGSPYSLTSTTKERWFRFTTLGDGLGNDAFRLLAPDLPLGSIPKLVVELYSDNGRPLRTGAAAMSLRGLDAGTYYLRVSTSDLSPANFSIEVSPPKDSQVIEALNVRDQDKLNGGEGNNKIIAANSGPRMDINPVALLFSNAILRNAVYSAINKRTGQSVLTSDLLSIAYLSAPGAAGSQLTDLLGIDRITNAISLNLPGHNLGDGALVSLKSLTRLQTLNLRGSSVQLSDLVNIPVTVRQLILGSIKDGANPASADKIAHALRRLTLLEDLQFGTSTTNLVIGETAAQDGPATIVNTTTNTVQLVRNLPPVVSLPSTFNSVSEGQTLTYTGLLASPGVSITDRDSIAATSAAIIDPSGVRTSLQSQTASPALRIAKDSNAKMSIALTERLRSSSFTLESWINVTSDATLPSANRDSVVVIDAASTSTSGYRIEVVRLGSDLYWGATVNGNQIYWQYEAAKVQKAVWTHVALVVSTGSSASASLLVNGTLVNSPTTLRAYTPPASGKDLKVGQSGYSFDELRIYNTARSQADINTSKDQPVPANAPNLVGYWNFDDPVARSTKQVNIPRHPVPTAFEVLGYTRQAPARIFTRFFVNPFTFESGDYLTMTSSDISFPRIGVRTESGKDYLYTVKDYKFTSDRNPTIVRIPLSEFIAYEKELNVLKPGDKIVEMFFDQRNSSIGPSVSQISVTSRIVQPDQITTEQLLQYTQVVRDLTSFGQNANVVDTTGLTSPSGARFDSFRSTKATNNAYTFKDDGTYLLELTAVDIDGASTTKTSKIFVSNVAPTTDIGGKPSGVILAGTDLSLSAIGNGPSVGGKATLDPSAIDADALKHEWKVNALSGQLISTTVSSTFKFTPQSAGTYIVTKTTNDPQGAADVDTFNLTVHPRVVFTPDATKIVSKEGIATNIDLAAGSSLVSDRASRQYAWTVKQGTIDVVSGTGNIVAFVPADNVAYTISATITDSFSVPVGPAQTFSSTSTMTFTPNDAAPTITILGLDPNGATAPVGTFQLVGQSANVSLNNSQIAVASGSVSYFVADAGSLDRQTVSISWGDGKTDHNVNPLSIASHKYDVPGVYDVKLTAIDTKNNAKSDATFKLTVAPVAPKVSVAPITPVKDGQSVTLVPTITYAGTKGQNEKVTWELVSPNGLAQSLSGREPKFTPDRSGLWGAIVTVDDGYGNVVRSQSTFLVNNLNPSNLTASMADVVDNSLVRTYSGNVRDFAADRLQGKLIVVNSDADTRVETPITLVKQGAPDANGIQSYTFSASVVLAQANGNIVSIEIVDQDGGIATITPAAAIAAPTDDYSNAVAYGVAKHIAAGPQLGERRTTESNLPTGTGVVATGDEDGITFNGLLPGATGTLTADVRNVGAAGAQLDAWIDFNGNNVFDANEQVLTSQSVTVSGKVTFNVSVPANAQSGGLVARVRLSQPSDGTLGPTGSAQYGEVEDYAITLGGLTFDRDASGNLLVTSTADRADVINASSDGTQLIFALDKVTDVTLTAAFTTAGGSIDNANKIVKIPLAQVTGETRLSTASGTDAISIQLGNNLPKFLLDNTAIAGAANTADTITITSGAAVNSASIAYTAVDQGTITVTPTTGTAQPITFSGPSLIKSQLNTPSLSIDAVAQSDSMKLRASATAGSFDLFASDALAVTFTQPTASVSVKATALDLLAGFAAPIVTTFDVGIEGTIRAAGLIDTTGLNLTGNVTLEGNTTLDSKGTVDGNIDLTGSVDGAFTLALNSGTGQTSISGDIGKATPLTSFVTDAGGPTLLKGGMVAASTILLNDPVTISGDTILSGDQLTAIESLTFNSPNDNSLDIRVNQTGDLKKPILQAGAGKLSLLHSGNGVTTVRGTNTYTGDTRIQLGELRLDVGATIPGNVILSGGKLGGKGEVLGTTTQSSGSTLNPGASPGILAISGDLQFANEAQLKLEFNGLVPGIEHDQILADGVAQSVDLSRVDLLVTVGYTPTIGDSFTVIHAVNPSSTVSGTFDDLSGKEVTEGGIFAAGGYNFRVNYDVDTDGDGAKNDVVFTIVDYARDFGSAPDSYLTKFANNGPRHRIGSGLNLGTEKNAELDSSSSDVDDGVEFGELRVGDDNAAIDIFVTDVTTQNAYIDGWIDFDQDGSFEASEQVFTSEYVSSGLNSLNISIPGSAQAGATYARFRLSSAGGLQPIGEAADGEVEDYAVTLLSNVDLGGAPGYGTASHIVGGPRLGNLVDMEASLTGSDNADDINDNDGVIFGEVQATGTAFVRVDASNVGAGAKLGGWIDFNGDGDFSDSGEFVFQNVAVVDGRNLLEFELPAGVVAKNTYARFRISTGGGLGPVNIEGPAVDGEVEDYALTIVPTRAFVTATTTVTLVGNDLVVQDGVDNTNDTLTMTSDGIYLTVSDPNNILSSDLALAQGSGTHSLRVPLAELADSIIFDTQSGNDTLTLDYSFGDLLGSIKYLGGAGNDSLVLKGRAFSGATLNVFSTASGSIAFADQEKIEYQAETVDSQLAIDDVTVSYGDGDDVITLSQTPSGISLSDTIRLANPERLKIVSGDGDDTIQVASNAASLDNSVATFVNFELTVDAGGQSGDELSIVNSADTTNDSFTIGSDSIVNGPSSGLFGIGGSLSYTGLAKLSIANANANANVTIDTDNLATEIDLSFAGNTQNALTLEGSLADNSLVVAMDSSNAGTIDLSSSEATVPTIGFENLDSIDAGSLAIATGEVTYSSTGETITLSDSGVAGTTRIVSSLSSTPSLWLSNPTELLTVSGGQIAADRLLVNGFGSGFAAAVRLNGNASGDSVQWNALTGTLASLHIDADSITLGGSIETTGDQTYAGNVQLLSNTTLTGDSVAIEGNIDAVANQGLSIAANQVSIVGASKVGALTISAPASADDSTEPLALVHGDVIASSVINIAVPLVIDVAVRMSGASIELSDVDSRETSFGSLTLVGSATLNGNVGSRVPLGTLTVGSVIIRGSTIDTMGLQTYAGQVDIENALEISGDASFTSNVIGKGSLTTTGDVLMTGVNTYQAGTHLAGGTFTLNGSLLSDVLVTDGTLSGTGTIQGNLAIGSNGLLAPTPSSTKALTIGGQLSFDSDGGFVLSGTNASTIGRVNAGSIGLGGAVLYDDLSFEPQLGDRLVFLSGLSLTGNFAEISSNEFISVGGVDALVAYTQPETSAQEFVITGYGDGDYGDAPFDSFKSELGAAHRAVGPTLGASRGTEDEGFVGDQQDNGVTVVGQLVASPTLATTGGLIINASGSGKLDAWIDFNHDQDWDPSEQIFASVNVVAGNNLLAFNIPAGTLKGDTYARFCLSTAGGLAPTGIALDGEVEDYVFTFNDAAVAQPLTVGVGSQPTELSLESGNIVTRVNGGIVSSVPISSVTSLIIEGDDTNNSVTIDTAAIPVGGLVYNGNGNGDFDTLSIRNSAGVATTLAHLFANSHDGTITVDGKMISYTGLEPIVDNLPTADRVFTFGGGDDQVTIGDSGTASDGISRITSVSSSESVDFVNPTSTIRVELGQGNNTLTFGTLDSGLSKPMTIVAGSGNDVLRASIGDLNMTGRTISKPEGVLKIDSRVTGSSFATDGDFAIELTAGGKLTSAMTFANTAGVTLGNESSDVFDFDGGLTSTQSLTSVQGTIRATNSPITLGDVVLTGDTVLTGSNINLGSVNGVGNLTLNGAVTLRGVLNISGTLTINGTLTLGSDAEIAHTGTTILNSALGGTFSLTKSGDGTLRLVDRTYSGQLSVSGGTVELPSGLVGSVVLDGGRLSAAGTLTNGLQSSGGGVLAIGSGPATLTTLGDIGLDSNTTLEIDLNGTTVGSKYDQLIVTGADRIVDLSDSVLSLNVGFTPVAGDSFTIISLADSTSRLTGQFNGLPQNALIQIGSSQFTIDYAGGDGNDVVLTARASSELDFGDAPDSYGTLLADDGARHFAVGPTLGPDRDIEVDGAPSVLADGDDASSPDTTTIPVANDETGVTQSSLSASSGIVITVGASNTLNIQVANAIKGTAKLDAWIDWNGNGTFDETERIAVAKTVTNGSNVLTFVTPDQGTTVVGTSYARFRVSSDGTPTATGLANDGEVEDYVVNLVEFNDLPTIAQSAPLTLPEDSEAIEFTLTGITTGGETEPLRLTVSSSDPTLIQSASITQGTNPGEGIVTITPVHDAFGTGTIVITVQDPGADGLFDTEDDGAVTSTVTVNVSASNDPPTGFADTLSLVLDENEGPQSIGLTDITAGPRETQNLTVSVSSDKPSLFKTLSVVRSTTDPTLATLNLETALNQRGTAKVTITIDDGLLRTTQVIDVQVLERNDPPTLNPINPIVLDVGTKNYTLNLTGISAGQSETQTLSVFAVDPTLGNNVIASATTTYQSPSTTGSVNLTFAANASGTTNYVIAVQDAGPDGIPGNSDDASHFEIVQISFNNAPTLNAIADARVLPTSAVQTVALAGITDGDNSGQLLRVTATSSNSAAVSAPTIVYDAASLAATGQLRYTPIALGASVITVTVTDAGWDGVFDSADDRSFIRTFTINVVSALNTWHNYGNVHDVDGDGDISPLDALVLINSINRDGDRKLPARSTSQPPYLDVDDNGELSLLDVLIVVNAINRSSTSEGEGESAPIDDLRGIRTCVDQVHADIGVGLEENLDSEGGDAWTDLDWLIDDFETELAKKRGKRS